MRRLGPFLFFALLPLFARGEYRVFLLKITKTPPSDAGAPTETPPPPPVDRFVESTLDPEQYRGYHPLAPDETITYTETWRCRGRTGGFKPHCPNPRSADPAADPALAPAPGPVPTAREPASTP